MSIYTGDSTAKVSRSTKGTDILNKMLLDQYSESTNLIEYYKAFIEEMDFLFESIEDTYLGMMLESATGDQLDKIGSILGQSRLVDLPDIYFGFDGASLSEGFSDDGDPTSGGIFRDGSSSSDDELSDETFRKILLVKAIVSNRGTCDINLVYYVVSVLLGRVPAKFRLEDVGLRDVRLVFGEGEVTVNETLLVVYAAPLFIPLGVSFNVITEVIGAITIEASSSFNTDLSNADTAGYGHDGSSAVNAAQTYLSSIGKAHETASNLSMASTIALVGEVIGAQPLNYLQYMVAEGAAALYAMDTAVGSTSLPDETGNGHDITILNATHEQAAIVNDTGNSILGTASTTTTNQTVPLPTGFTYEFWVRLSTARTSSNSYLISRNNELDVIFNYGGANTFGLFANIIASVPATSLQVVVPRDDTGYHVAITYDKATGTCNGYLDGVLVDTHAAPTNIAYQNVVSIFDSYGSTGEFKEEVDMLSMFDGALDATTILDHYQKGILDWAEKYYSTIINSSPFLLSMFNDNTTNDEINSNHGTDNSTTSTTALVENSGTPSLSRAMVDTAYISYDTAIQALHTVASNDFAIEFWFSTVTSDTGRTLVSVHVLETLDPLPPFDPIPEPLLVLSQDGNNLRFAANGLAGTVTSAVINDGNPHHVVITSEFGVGSSIYIDGALDHSSTYIDAELANYCALGQLVESAVAPISTDGFIGNVDAFALYNNTISAAQVLTNYNYGI